MGDLVTAVPPSPDHPPATYWVQHTTSCITQSNAPEGGQNYCPKHVELIWIYQLTVLVASGWLSSLPSLLMLHGQTNIKFVCTGGNLALKVLSIPNVCLWCLCHMDSRIKVCRIILKINFTKLFSQSDWRFLTLLSPCIFCCVAECLKLYTRRVQKVKIHHM